MEPAARTGPAMSGSQQQSCGDRLVDEPPDALIALSFDGRVLFWSRGAESIFGYAAGEAVRPSLEQLIVPAEDREAMRAMLTRTTAEGAVQFDAVRRRRDGTLVHVEISQRRGGGAEPIVAGGAWTARNRSSPSAPRTSPSSARSATRASARAPSAISSRRRPTRW